MSNRRVSKLLWLGDVDEPKRMRTPPNLKTVVVGFELMMWLYAALVLVRTEVDLFTVSPAVDDIIVRSCFVQASCEKTYRFQSYNARIRPEGSQVLIDGSGSLRCSVDICVEPRQRPLRFTLGSSVLNLRGINRGARRLPFAIEVRQWEQEHDSTNKVFIADVSIPSFHVNITRGIVIASNIRTSNATILLGFGSLVLSFDFLTDAHIRGLTENGAFCVHPAVSYSAPACVPSDGVADCPFSATVHNVSAVSLAPAEEATQISFVASSLYINEFVSDLTERTFVNQSRIAGPGMESPPRLHPKVYEKLNSTSSWNQLSTIDDHVQAVEIVTPSVGMLFMQAKRAITLEVGPEYMAFLSAFALRPQYRRLTSPLNHYRCRSEHGRELFRSGSLINVHLLDPGDYERWTRDDFRVMLESHYSLDDQFVTASEIHSAVGDQRGVVAFVTPATEHTRIDDFQGNRWKLYRLGLDEDGDVTTYQLKMSNVAVAILIISIFTSLITAVAVVVILYVLRGRILLSFLMHDVREMQRTMVDHRSPVPYHYFFSVLSISSWLTFRLCQHVQRRMWYPTKVRPFTRFLRCFYTVPTDGDRADAQATSCTRKASIDQLQGQYSRWMLLRYREKREDDGSREELLEQIDDFGGRRHRDNKIIIRGLRMKKKVNVKARFSLQYSVIQSFFDVTHSSEDFILLDDLFYRALAEDPGVTEDQVLSRLAQWKLKVERLEVEIVSNVVPRVLNPLNEEHLARVIAMWEENCASFPSHAVVEWWTTGVQRRKLRTATWVMWVCIETVLNFTFTFLPFVLAYCIALPLEIEHARYSTSTSILLVDELLLATTDLSAPRPQNIVSTTIFGAGMVFSACMLVEPLLVWATFRTVGRFRWSLLMRVNEFGLLYVRVIVTSLSMLSLACTSIFVMTYAFNVLIWWVLGAVIAPTRMLVYASSVGTFLYLLASTWLNLNSMRETVLNRLREQIFQRLLVVIRESPMADLFQTAQQGKADIEAHMGDGAQSDQMSLTSGDVLDLVTEAGEKRDRAIERISTALSAPPAFIFLGLAVVKREQRLAHRAVSEVFAALKLPQLIEPLAQQLVLHALRLPASAMELSHALYRLVPEHEARLMQHDEVIVPIVQSVMNRTADRDVLVRSACTIAAIQIAKLADVPPRLIDRAFDCALAIQSDRHTDALRQLVIILEELQPRMPVEPPVVPVLCECVVEGLKMATNQPHSFAQSAMELVRFAGFDRSPLFMAIAPLLLSSEEEQLAAVRLDTNVDRAAPDSDHVAIPIVRRIARLVALKFALSQEQLAQLLNLFQLISSNAAALSAIPERAQQFPSTRVMQGAISWYNAAKRRQAALERGDNCAACEAESLLIELASGAERSPAKQLEAWIADQWLSIDALFALLTTFPTNVDVETLARDIDRLWPMPAPLCAAGDLDQVLGVPREALQFLREGVAALRALAVLLFGDELLSLARHRDAISAAAIGAATEAVEVVSSGFADGKRLWDGGPSHSGDAALEVEALEKLIVELATFLLNDLKLGDVTADLKFNRHFVKSVVELAGRNVLHSITVGTTMSDRLSAAKQFATKRREGKLKMLQRVIGRDTVNATDGGDTTQSPPETSFADRLLSVVKDVLVEFVAVQTTDQQSDVAAAVKKMALFLLREGCLQLHAGNSASLSALFGDLSSGELEQAVDDIVDIFAKGGANLSSMEVENIALTLGVKPRLLDLLLNPVRVLRVERDPALALLPTLLSVLNGALTKRDGDASRQRSAAAENDLTDLIHALGVTRERAGAVYTLLMFFTESSPTLDEVMLPPALEGLQLDRCRDALLSAIRRRRELRIDSLVALAAEGVLKKAVQLTSVAAVAHESPQQPSDRLLTSRQVAEAVNHAMPLHSFLRWLHHLVDGDAESAVHCEPRVRSMLIGLQELLAAVCPSLWEHWFSKKFSDTADQIAAVAGRRQSSTAVSGSFVGGDPTPVAQELRARVAALLRETESLLRHSTVRTFLAPQFPAFFDTRNVRRFTPARAESEHDNVPRSGTVFTQDFEAQREPALQIDSQTNNEGKDRDDDILSAVRAAFELASPFALLRDDCPPKLREVMGLMLGILAWFPRDIPPKAAALLSASVTQDRTAKPVLQLLAGALPLRVRPLALELMCLTTKEHHSVTAVADFTGVDVERAKVLHEILTAPVLPPSVDCPAMRWFGVLRALAEGDPVAVFSVADLAADAASLAVDSDATSGDGGAEVAAEAVSAAEARRQLVADRFRQLATLVVVSLPQSSLLRDVVADLFAGIDIRSSIGGAAGKLVKELRVDEFARTFEALARRLERMRGPKPALHKFGMLACGALYLMQNNFSMTRQCLRDFVGGKDPLQLAMAELLVVVARLVLEEGAVDDMQSVVSAFQNLMTALPLLVVAGTDKTSREAANTDDTSCASTPANSTLTNFVAVIGPYAERVLGRMARILATRASNGGVVGSTSSTSSIRLSWEQPTTGSATLPKVTLHFDANEVEPRTVLTGLHQAARMLGAFLPAADNVADVLERLLTTYDELVAVLSPTPLEARKALTALTRLRARTASGHSTVSHVVLEREKLLRNLVSRVTGATREACVAVREAVRELSTFDASGRRRGSEKLAEAATKLSATLHGVVAEATSSCTAEATSAAIQRYVIAPIAQVEAALAAFDAAGESWSVQPNEPSDAFDAGRMRVGLVASELRADLAAVRATATALREALNASGESNVATATRIVGQFKSNLAHKIESIAATLQRSGFSVDVRNPRAVFVGTSRGGDTSLADAPWDDEDDAGFIDAGSELEQLDRVSDATLDAIQEFTPAALGTPFPVLDAALTSLEMLTAAITQMRKVCGDVEKALALLPRVGRLIDLADDVFALASRLATVAGDVQISEGERMKQILAVIVPLLVDSDGAKIAEIVVELVVDSVEKIGAVVANPTVTTSTEAMLSVLRHSLEATEAVHAVDDTRGFRVPPDVYAGIHFAEAVRAIIISHDKAHASDSGATIIMQILELFVHGRTRDASLQRLSQSSTRGELRPLHDARAVSAAVPATGMLPIGEQDHRKLQLLCGAASGDLTAIPDLIKIAGIGMPDAHLNRLRSLLTTMQSMRRLAEGRSVGSLSAQDVVDVIAMQIFNEFDLQRTGKITFDQFRHAMTRMKLPLSTEEAKLFFSKVDTDGSGAITPDEFKRVLDGLQERFRRLLLDELSLSKEAIYVALVWTAMWVAFLLTFIILGVHGFADGEPFTAVITGIMPACGILASTLRDPNFFNLLTGRVDRLVVSFFARMRQL